MTAFDVMLIGLMVSVAGLLWWMLRFQRGALAKWVLLTLYPVWIVSVLFALWLGYGRALPLWAYPGNLDEYYEVLGFHYDDSEKRLVMLLLPPGEPEPLTLDLPYDRKTVENLEETKEQARQRSGRILINLRKRTTADRRTRDSGLTAADRSGRGSEESAVGTEDSGASEGEEGDFEVRWAPSYRVVLPPKE